MEIPIEYNSSPSVHNFRDGGDKPKDSSGNTIKNREMGWSNGVVSYEKSSGTLPEYILWNMRDFVEQNKALFNSDIDLIRIYMMIYKYPNPIGFYGSLSVIWDGHKRVLEIMKTAGKL